MMRITTPIEQLIAQCSFNGVEVKNCGEIGRKIVDREHGVCYLIDVARFLGAGGFQHTPGIGLRMVLDLHSEVDPVGPLTRELESLFDGITVRVENPHDPAAYGGVLASPGTYTSLREHVQSREHDARKKWSNTLLLQPLQKFA